jgi:hypothetical protein
MTWRRMMVRHQTYCSTRRRCLRSRARATGASRMPSTLVRGVVADAQTRTSPAADPSRQVGPGRGRLRQLSARARLLWTGRGGDPRHPALEGHAPGPSSRVRRSRGNMRPRVIAGRPGASPAVASAPAGAVEVRRGRRGIGQLMRLTHNAAIARPCRTARGTMTRSQSPCNARALDGVSCSSVAAMRVRLIGALTRR